MESVFELDKKGIRIKKHSYGFYQLVDLKTRFILGISDKTELNSSIVRVTIRKQQLIHELLKHFNVALSPHREQAHFKNGIFIVPSDYFKSLALHQILFMINLVQNTQFEFFKQNASDRMINKMYNYYSLQKIAFKDKVYLVANDNIVCYQGSEIDPNSELYSSIMAKLQLLL